MQESVRRFESPSLGQSFHSQLADDPYDNYSSVFTTKEHLGSNAPDKTGRRGGLSSYHNG